MLDHKSEIVSDCPHGTFLWRPSNLTVCILWESAELFPARSGIFPENAEPGILTAAAAAASNGQQDESQFIGRSLNLLTRQQRGTNLLRLINQTHRISH